MRVYPQNTKLLSFLLIFLASLTVITVGYFFVQFYWKQESTSVQRPESKSNEDASQEKIPSKEELEQVLQEPGKDVSGTEKEIKNEELENILNERAQPSPSENQEVDAKKEKSSNQEDSLKVLNEKK